MKKMIWGEQPAQNQQAAEESKDGDEGNATFTGTVRPDQIVKEGWLYKRSRYLQ